MFRRLYIHIPFCVQKCPYCAFVSRQSRDGGLGGYHTLLLRELRSTADQGINGGPLDSVYFGGGTPSLLQPDQIARVLEASSGLYSLPTDAEITLEANPGTLEPARLRAFRSAGINRISLGVQSFDDRFLECLGRIHSAEQARQAFLDARQAGFDNISIDLMHALPGQTIDRWRSDLLAAVELLPEHISIYGLTIEDGTSFALRYPDGTPELPDDDLSADMFELADDLLTAAGYDHYEIANYARPGYRSRHNSGYWLRDGYLGVGVGAHSLLRDGYGVRFSNPDGLEGYARELASGGLKRIGMQQLTREDAMAEFMYLGLRLSDGVDLDMFEREFGCSWVAVYGAAVADLVRLGLLRQNLRYLQLTRRGMLLSNQVFARFLP